jgi:hypothetical protein
MCWNCQYSQRVRHALTSVVHHTPQTDRSFKGAAPRGGVSRNYLEWWFDTQELFRVVVKSELLLFIINGESESYRQNV